MKNHIQNAVEKLVADPFIQSEVLANLWINSLIFHRDYFIVYIQVDDNQNILKIRC